MIRIVLFDFPVNFHLSLQHVTPTPRNFDGGLYTGYLGIAWACFAVLRKNAGEISPDTQRFLLAKSHDLVNAALARVGSVTKQSNNKEDRLSMLLGESGVWMTAAMLYHVGTICLTRRILSVCSKNLAQLEMNECTHFPLIINARNYSSDVIIGKHGSVLAVQPFRPC